MSQPNSPSYSSQNSPSTFPSTTLPTPKQQHLNSYTNPTLNYNHSFLHPSNSSLSKQRNNSVVSSSYGSDSEKQSLLPPSNFTYAFTSTSTTSSISTSILASGRYRANDSSTVFNNSGYGSYSNSPTMSSPSSLNITPSMTPNKSYENLTQSQKTQVKNAQKEMKKLNLKLINQQKLENGNNSGNTMSTASTTSSSNSHPSTTTNSNTNPSSLPEKMKEEDGDASTNANSSLLAWSFLFMTFVGLGNRIFGKLQTIPMHPYPFFNSLLSTFIYVPLCFLYILPMQYFQKLDPAQYQIPKIKFAIMGALDSISGIMSTFALNYIPNASLVVLLGQASIPISMTISYFFLSTNYSVYQICGAIIVMAGIVAVVIPQFQHPDPLQSGEIPPENQGFWIAVQFLSIIPGVFSSVYKEKSLSSEAEIDVLYLNGWVAVYQSLFAIFLAVPSAWGSGLTVSELPSNIVDGMKCTFGYSTWVVIAAASASSNANASANDDYDYASTIDSYNGFDSEHGLYTPTSPTTAPTNTIYNDCSTAPFYVSSYLFFNLGLNILMVLILKHGSAAILSLSSTVLVPLGNWAFSLHFIPGHRDVRKSDMIGLGIIMSGLLWYRYGESTASSCLDDSDKPQLSIEEVLARRKATARSAAYGGLAGASTGIDSRTNENVIQAVIQRDLAMRKRVALNRALVRSPAVVRGSLLFKLGVAESPQIAGRYTPNARGSRSPALLADKMLKDLEGGAVRVGGSRHNSFGGGARGRDRVSRANSNSPSGGIGSGKQWGGYNNFRGGGNGGGGGGNGDVGGGGGGGDDDNYFGV